jgi:hypothetical protein
MTRKEKAAANIAKLPEMAYIAVPEARCLCVVRRGEPGYLLTDMAVGIGRTDAHVLARGHNERLGVSELEAEAMRAGSMFGWHVDGADLDYVKRLRARQGGAA